MITPPQNPPRGGDHGPVPPGDRLDEEGRHPEYLEGLRGTAAENLERLAEGAQAAASTLQHDDVGHLSEYVSDMATRMTTFSNTLRTSSGDEILRDVSRMARDNPALFLTGSVAIGFGLARFARASQTKALHENTSESPSRSHAEPGTSAEPQGGIH